MNSLPYSPHDLLPIQNPSLEEHKNDSMYFYNNVVQHLIPDIVRMEANGIPIDLNKVKELEETVSKVLEEVQDKLSKNNLIAQFLNKEFNNTKKNKQEELENKKKTVEDFIKPFDPKNKIHRTYVVNFYLKERPDLQMDEWSIKDLKKLNQILSSAFIQNIIDKKDMSENCLQWMRNQIELGMFELAKDKCEAYNKNKIDSKIDDLDNKISIKFNPASSTQKRKLFEFLGIESENETKAGNDKWDRNELENL